MKYAQKFKELKLFLSVVSFCLIWTNDVTASIPNSHHKLPCTDCHPQKPQAEIPQQEKKSFGSLKGITPCLDCHEQDSNLHPIGIIPVKSDIYLPLSNDKEITCLTCHFIHAKTGEYSLLRGFPEGQYKHFSDFCYQCHGMEFYQLNPHKTSEAQKNCPFCHMSIPRGKQSSQIKRLCSFCHSKQVHMTIKEQTSKNCTECHAPHGTEETVHYLEKNLICNQPPEANPHQDNNSCKRCHAKQPREKKPVNFLYSGNIVALCTSCHWGQNFMHPIEIIIPSPMQIPKNLPLSIEEKITCQTCHDSCTKHRVKGDGLIRQQQGYKSRNDLCFECHKRERYARINPHKEQYNPEKCIYCHDHDVRLSYWKKDGKMVMKTTEYLLCMRCHEDNDIPNFKSHKLHRNMTTVKLLVPEAFPLSAENRITCSTCHNPHFWEGNKTSLRGELSQKRFCENCHPEL